MGLGVVTTPRVDSNRPALLLLRSPFPALVARGEERLERERILEQMMQRDERRLQPVAYQARVSTCVAEGCTLLPVYNVNTGALQARGFCGRHAAQRGLSLPRGKFCSVEGRGKHARSRGKCAEHGGVKRCAVEYVRRRRRVSREEQQRPEHNSCVVVALPFELA